MKISLKNKDEREHIVRDYTLILTILEDALVISDENGDPIAQLYICPMTTDTGFSDKDLFLCFGNLREKIPMEKDFVSVIINNKN